MNVYIYKIKKEKQDILKKWGKTIMSDCLIEAIASLEEENCEAENISIFSLGSDLYAVGIMVPKTGRKILPFNKNREINKKHFKILKECLGERLPIETVYSIHL